MDRQAFERFAGPLLRDCLAIGWLPRVTEAERESFENFARRLGLPDFRISDRGDDGRLRPAVQRSEYMPLLYGVSRNAGRIPYGFDFLAPEARRGLLTLAIEGGGPVVSGRVSLAATPPPDDAGLALVAPVYPTLETPVDSAGRQSALRGFVMITLSLRQVVDSGISPQSGNQLAVELVDVTGGEDESIYRTAAPAAGSTLLRSHTVRLPERTFDILIRPTEAFLARNRAPLAPWILIGGGVSSLLAAAYAFTLVSQRRRMLALVETRTQELLRREQALAASEERWSLAFDSTGDGVWDWDILAGSLYYSPAWKTTLGYDEEDVGSELSEWAERVHPDDMPRYLAEIQRHLDGETPSFNVECRMRCKSGEWKWILDRGMAVQRDEDGKPLRVVGTHTDISLRKSTELQLSRANAQLRGLLDAATQVAIVAVDLKGIVGTFNVGAERMLGYTCAEVEGKLPVECLHLPEEVAARAEELGRVLQRSVSGFEALVAQRLDRSGHDEREWTFVRRDGSQLVVNLLVTAVSNGNGERVGYLYVASDITERKRATSVLEARDRLLEKLTAQVPGAIYQFQLEAEGHRHFPYVSAGMRELIEVELDSLRCDGNGAFERLHPEDRERVEMSIRRSAEQLSPWREDFRCLLPSKGLRWLRGEAIPERAENDAVLWHGYLSDITGSKLVEQELRELSITDALTGVYNRRYFQEHLEAEVMRLQRHGGCLALVMLDVDRFKQVNDLHGHAVGDRVLRTLCQRISSRLRRSDVFCRLGGEEFIVLCLQTTGEQAQVLTRALMEALRGEPVEDVGVVTASFGVASWHEGESADALLRRADMAVYAAKQAGRDRMRVAPA